MSLEQLAKPLQKPHSYVVKMNRGRKMIKTNIRLTSDSPTLRQPMHWDQVELMQRLMDELLRISPDKMDRLAELPEYDRFHLGGYALGFICRDIPTDVAGNIYQLVERNLDTVEVLSIGTIRYVLHYMLRAERHGYCGEPHGGGVVHGALQNGLLSSLTRRIKVILEQRFEQQTDTKGPSVKILLAASESNTLSIEGRIRKGNKWEFRTSRASNAERGRPESSSNHSFWFRSWSKVATTIDGLIREGLKPEWVHPEFIITVRNELEGRVLNPRASLISWTHLIGEL